MTSAEDGAPLPFPGMFEDPEERDFPVSELTRPRRMDGVREYPLGESELMLFAEDRQVVHTVNVSAWAVWELCDGTRTISEIAAELGPAVSMPAETILPDVLATVERLGALGLVGSA